VKDNFKDV
jgi:hypothetical protein